jgi:hypothetical protein
MFKLLKILVTSFAFFLFSLVISGFIKQDIVHASPPVKLTISTFEKTCTAGDGSINEVCPPGTVYISHQCEYSPADGGLVFGRALVDSFKGIEIAPVASCTFFDGSICPDGTQITMTLVCAE